MKIKCKARFLLAVLLMLSSSVFAQFNLVPLPQKIVEGGSSFLIKPQTRIYYTKGLKQQAELLVAALSPATGYDFVLLESNRPVNGIALSTGDSGSANKESYKLNVNKDLITIKGNTSAGVFYGIQTLLQMLPPEVYSKERQKALKWEIKGAEITDAPLYPWRGMMLDVARYFFSKEYVLRFIDMMAMYKMNALHFHLTDDSGWRIEIKKYPKLTSVGGFSGVGPDRKGGYYTQDDLREMVAYAATRNVDIIPELELPAHAQAAVAAYPYLCCTGDQYEVQTQHAISKEILCAGKESTYEFIDDIIKETVALFPSKYLHIGGDEAVYTRWKACPVCQKKKTSLGLKTEEQLRLHFNHRVQKIASKYGKTIVGWDEIIEDGLEEKAVGMIWHDAKKAFKAAEAGHYSVMSLTGYCYFDVAESSIPGEVKAATWLSPISLEKVYQLNPMLEGMDEKYRPLILGASATLWSDQFIHGTILQEIPMINENRSEQYFDYLTFPRMSALAEVLWTPVARQNWKDFENRMRSHYARYDAAGYGYRMPQPKLISHEKGPNGYVIKLENRVNGAEIRYSIDGSIPNVYSPVYTKAVTVPELKDFYAITVLNRSQFSLPLYFPDKLDKFKKYGELVAEWNPQNVQGKDFGLLEMNGSGKINGNGNYALHFWYTGGDSRLDIQSIEVYKNGVKVAEDLHEGFTGSAEKNNKYSFKIDNYETGAAFTIKAKVRGDLNDNTTGVVMIKKI
ncbi:beta-N-acetylhexosaminidase [Pedobacter gandavensis]|uniref:beta-N-acetylhexosaminidase n=1 Tax=Pedobacter gandavensis TaxID=2679963 RepID=A0ABR6EV23_9SPHI|nr:family 20 glycosylhydrolase [Pedobacter gandavensis]MBB2149047.1 family 20 glycosylhydrolase [Pedobacter gandavensis]